MYCNVNCVYADSFGNCNAKRPILGLFKRSCEEYGTLSQTCVIAKRHPRPDPPPAPIRRGKRS